MDYCILGGSIALAWVLENLVDHQPNDKEWQSKEVEHAVRILLELGRKEVG